jgi:hypothetical protein
MNTQLNCPCTLLKHMSQNVCVELIPTATANGYPKCNYSVMNTRSSNFHIYIYMNNTHSHDFKEYLCKRNVGKNDIWDSTFCRRQNANDRKMTISAFGTLLA